jgi:hypothetical protein
MYACLPCYARDRYSPRPSCGAVTEMLADAWGDIAGVVDRMLADNLRNAEGVVDNELREEADTVRESFWPSASFSVLEIR